MTQDDSGATNIDVGFSNVTANDTSTINSDTAAASIAFVASGKIGVSLAIGASLATNQIANQVEASVVDVGAYDADGFFSISSNQFSTIKASSIAASLAAAVAGKLAVGVSGAGATADNQISNKTLAFVEASTITNAGGMDVRASNTSDIDAIIVAAAGAVGGGAIGGGAAIGVSLATNTIGTPIGDAEGEAIADRSSQVKAYIDNSSVNVSGSLSIDASVSDSIDAQVFAGSVAAALGKVSGAGAALVCP